MKRTFTDSRLKLLFLLHKYKSYRQAIEDAGLRIVADQVNDQYRFLSDNAQGATKKFGVKSVSLRADKR